MILIVDIIIQFEISTFQVFAFSSFDFLVLFLQIFYFLQFSQVYISLRS